MVSDIKPQQDVLEDGDGYYLKSEGYSCKGCNEIFLEKRQWQDHYKTHSFKKRYFCSECNLYFRYSWDLKKHMFQTHKEGKKFEICDICGQGCTTTKILAKHRQRHLKLGFRCQKCKQGFAFKTELSAHIENVHLTSDTFCSICNKAFSNKFNYKVHYRIYHDKDYVAPTFYCPTCGQACKSRSYLNKHIRSHDGFPCDICGKVLTTKKSLSDHLLVHKGQKPFACDICCKGFGKKRTLQIHMRQHTGEKPYECRECGKKFTQRTSLVLHSRYHTGERPYVCNVCDKGFVYKTLLVAHKVSSHNVQIR